MDEKKHQRYFEYLLQGKHAEEDFSDIEEELAKHQEQQAEECQVKFIYDKQEQERQLQYIPFVEHYNYKISLGRWGYDVIRSKFWNEAIRYALNHNDWYELELDVYRSMKNKVKVETITDINFEEDRVVFRGIPQSRKPEDYFRTSDVIKITTITKHLAIKTRNSTYAFIEWKDREED